MGTIMRPKEDQCVIHWLLFLTLWMTPGVCWGILTLYYIRERGWRNEADERKIRDFGDCIY